SAARALATCTQWLRRSAYRSAPPSKPLRSRTAKARRRQRAACNRKRLADSSAFVHRRVNRLDFQVVRDDSGRDVRSARPVKPEFEKNSDDDLGIICGRKSDKPAVV